MLGNLLKTLQGQETGGAFTFDTIVVDNDAQGSAKDTVIRAGAELGMPIRYAIEPEQNISLARNRALRMAGGDFAACLDDDEFADGSWLAGLLHASIQYGAEGVLGPVIPSYETPPPRWVTKGKLLVRESFPTGTILKSHKQTRAGNFLISRNMIQDNPELFNPEYGKLGGEDTDFFRRMLERGYRLVWCNEARVYETIPSSRLKRSYFLKRGLLTGVVRAGQAPLPSVDTLKSLAAFLVYSICLPFLCVLRPRLIMPILVKDCHHVAKLLARCGLKVVRRRPG